MKFSQSHVMSAVALATSLLLVSCGDSDQAQSESMSPQEMYAKAEALIKPNVEGAASDFKGAYEWLRKSAEAGYVQAQTDLGGIYMYGGKDIKADWKEAYRWFSAAAAQGRVEAHQFLGIMLLQGAEELPADAKAALNHFKIAAEAGLPEAMYRLGLIYISLEEHAQEGVQWLEKAAQAGQHEAARDLGFAYASGTKYIESDINKSIQCLQQAADMGDAQALFIIGVIYSEGQGVERDMDKGLAALRLSAGQAYVPAMKRLVQYLSLDSATAEMKKEAEAWKKQIETFEAKESKAVKSLMQDAGQAVEQAPVSPVIVP